MARNKEFYKTFAWEFVRTNSGAQAYLNAKGLTAVTPKERLRASASAGQLLRNRLVRKYIQLIRDEQRIGVTEIVSEIANIIRFDPIDLLNSDGTVKPMHEMPETARKMITSIKINELWMGRGDDREQYGLAKEIKFISKMDAIEKAMKHLGGYKEDNDQKKAVTQIAIFQLPDNGRTEGVDAVTVGEVISYEEVPIAIDEGKRSNLFSGMGDKVNRARGGGVQGNTGEASHLTPDIQTEFGPGD